jgi:hypothetical protein
MRTLLAVCVILAMTGVSDPRGTAQSQSDALSGAPDARIAFCRPAAGASCDCSVEVVETRVTPDEATALLVAMRRVGAVSATELQKFQRQRDAACVVAGSPR